MDTYLEGIRKVTPEEVQRAAKKYLTEENRTVGTLIPMKGEK
jgi:zinc protease